MLREQITFEDTRGNIKLLTLKERSRSCLDAQEPIGEIPMSV